MVAILKVIILYFNVQLGFTGIGFLVTGVAVEIAKKEFAQLSLMQNLPGMLILLGGAMLIAAILGCILFARETYIKNLLYINIMCCVAILLLITLYETMKFKKVARDYISDMFEEKFFTPDKRDEAQKQQKCCGMYNYEYYTDKGEKVPPSCCGYSSSQECPPTIYEKKPGCLQFIGDKIDKVFVYILYFFCILLVWPIIIIIFSILRTIQMKRKSSFSNEAE